MIWKTTWPPFPVSAGFSAKGGGHYIHMKCSYPPRILHSVVIKTRMEKNINKIFVII